MTDKRLENVDILASVWSHFDLFRWDRWVSSLVSDFSYVDQNQTVVAWSCKSKYCSLMQNDLAYFTSICGITSGPPQKRLGIIPQSNAEVMDKMHRTQNAFKWAPSMKAKSFRLSQKISAHNKNISICAECKSGHQNFNLKAPYWLFCTPVEPFSSGWARACLGAAMQLLKSSFSSSISRMSLETELRLGERGGEICS